MYFMALAISDCFLPSHPTGAEDSSHGDRKRRLVEALRQGVSGVMVHM
jgi:hypothetical protein